MKGLRTVLRWSLWILGGVIASLLLLIGYLEASQRYNRYVLEQSLKEKTMTMEMPFQIMNSSTRTEALSLLNQLPNLSELGGDGVRIAVMPALLLNRYTIAVLMPSQDAPHALGVSYHIIDDGKVRWIEEFRFNLPVDAYRVLVSGIDARTDGWLGEADFCLDGTVLAFERVRGSLVTSGLAHCGTHAAELRRFVLDGLRQYAPSGSLPPPEK